jgi:cyclase
MKSIFAAVIGISLVASFVASAPLPRFVKVSPNFYYLQSAGDEGNVGAVVTDDGVILIDTQRERNVPQVLEALRRVTGKPVAWVVNTHHHEDHTGGNAYFLTRNVPVIGSRETLLLLERTTGEAPVAAPGERNASLPDSPLRFSFRRQMQLFPRGVEVRIFSVGHKAHTSGDVVISLPAEKILYVGDLYRAGSYPIIDGAGGGGSALGWLDGTREVVESVKLLKSAMPQPKPSPAATPVPEKTLEESIIVIPGHGPATNLRELKSLLEASQKLRAEINRALASGRSRDALLSSPASDPFRSYKNFEAYASQLYDDLARK